MSHHDDPPRDRTGRGEWNGDSDAFDRGGAGSATTHVDGDTLALVALDEPAGAAVDAHVAGCPACQAEIRSLARVVTMGRSLDTSAELMSPPRGVWERIAADLGIDPALLPAAATVTNLFADAAATPPALPTAISGTDAVDSQDRFGRTDGEPIVNLKDRRDQLADSSAGSANPGSANPGSSAGTRRGRIGRGLLIAATVAGILTGVGITLGWEALDGPAVVESALLTPLDGNSGDGEAMLVGSGTKRELKVQLDVDPAPGTYFQVWLMSPDTTRMVPVGVLENGDGFWRVPAGLDVSDFPLVDVSIEAFDGNSAHSGDSLVRGDLSAA